MGLNKSEYVGKWLFHCTTSKAKNKNTTATSRDIIIKDK